MIRKEPASESRRVRMTKRLLKDALVELLEKKSLAEVKVTEVCELADVNRSTFYSYYNDVFELLGEIEIDFIDQIPGSSKGAKIENDKDSLYRFTEFFEYVKQHARDFNVLLLRADNAIFCRMMLDKIFSQYSPTNSSRIQGKDRYGYIFAMNGVLGIMREWIADDFPMSTEEFASFALNLCFNSNQTL